MNTKPFLPLNRLDISIDLPQTLKERYTQYKFLEEINIESITKSYNQRWKNQIDTRFNKGQYYTFLWNQLIEIPKEIKEYIYDQQGKLKTENYFLFNGEGNVIEYKTEQNNKKSNQIFSIKYNEYNNIINIHITGNVEKEIQFEYDTSQQITSYRITNESIINFTYNENHQIIEIKEFTIKGKKEKLTTLSSFKYNKSGNLILAEKYNCPEKEFIVKQIYNYDKNQNLIKLETLSGTIEFKYDDNKNLIEEQLKQSYNPNVQKSIWKYDEENRLISYQWVGGYETHFKYDNTTGYLTQTKRFINIGKREEKPYKIHQFIYDEIGNLIQIERKSSDFTLIEKFIYDEKSRLISHLKQGDISDKCAYVYDEKGALIEGNYKNVIGKREIRY